MSFYDFSDFEAVLKGATIKEQFEDMEAPIFFGLCMTNPKERFLNTEGRVGTRGAEKSGRHFSAKARFALDQLPMSTCVLWKPNC